MGGKEVLESPEDIDHDHCINLARAELIGLYQRSH